MKKPIFKSRIFRYKNPEDWVNEQCEKGFIKPGWVAGLTTVASSSGSFTRMYYFTTNTAEETEEEMGFRF